jgi:aminoglycoside/choline kinase family phosphotransferase
MRAFLEEAGWPGDTAAARRRRLHPHVRTHIAPRRNGDPDERPGTAEGPPLYEGRSYDAVAHRALDVVPFIAIGDALRGAGVRTPAMLAADPGAGLLVLEDLGAEPIVDASGAPIMERYEAAVDLLAAMHAKPWPEQLPLPGGGSFQVPPYDRDALLIEISLFPDWFGGHGGEPAFPKSGRADFLAAWSRVLEGIESGPKTLVLRDFHSPNILWQEGASGTDRVGVLDFQDALIGHPAYDVASLAQDARVPLTQEQEQHLKTRYVAARRAQRQSFDIQEFDAAYAILAAQRATKVLGAFTPPGVGRRQARLRPPPGPAEGPLAPYPEPSCSIRPARLV